ncbi:hypothetical protein PWR63_23740 [Paraburkholderia sp. A2WS-5]|uniref:hypothetical protein n=1 Tax=Paraburkholderia sp. A2WS-5 TaxID=3028372 RepID=UPI003B7D5F9B
MADPEEETLDLTGSGGAGFAKGDVKFDIEKEKIALAKLILIGLAVIFVMSFLFLVAKCPFIDNESAKTAFEFIKETFPPIVTLVLGAYFTRKND